MKDRNAAIPASYLILEQDGKILLARRCNTGYEDGNYQMPAGHVEAGELPKEAMVREAKEELGIDVALEDLEFIHFSYRTKMDKTSDRIDIFFHATTWSGEIVNNEPDKCDDLSWFSWNELPSNMPVGIARVLECIQAGVIYSELPARL